MEVILSDIKIEATVSFYLTVFNIHRTRLPNAGKMLGQRLDVGLTFIQHWINVLGSSINPRKPTLRFCDPISSHYSWKSSVKNTLHSDLTLKSAEFFYSNLGGVFSIWNRPKCLIQVMPIHLNTYDMLWVYGYYKYFKSYSEGVDFSRQNLTSTDVRFWRLKSIPSL